MNLPDTCLVLLDRGCRDPLPRPSRYFSGEARFGFEAVRTTRWVQATVVLRLQSTLGFQAHGHHS